MKRSPLRRKTSLRKVRKKPLSDPSRLSAPSISEIDALWSKVVKTLAAHECQLWNCRRRCGGIMNAHHIFSRTSMATRWDLENGVCICHGHHRWIHSNPAAGTDEIREMIGDERYERIKARHYQTVQYRAEDRRRIFGELTKALEERS